MIENGDRVRINYPEDEFLDGRFGTVMSTKHKVRPRGNKTPGLWAKVKCDKRDGLLLEIEIHANHLEIAA